MTLVRDPSLFDPPAPAARLADPETSRAAAERIAPANGELVRRIRGVVLACGPISAFGIVEKLGTDRWQSDSIRSAVSRAGLTRYDKLGRTPSGGACLRFVLPWPEITDTRPL